MKPEYADQWLTLTADITAASNAEPGCLEFAWYRSGDDPNMWALIESFRDVKAGAARATVGRNSPNSAAEPVRELVHFTATLDIRRQMRDERLRVDQTAERGASSP